MNNLRQSLEQALNELEIGRAFLAAEILKSVINQPEQEPVAWRIRCTDPMQDWVLMCRYPDTEKQFANVEIQPLYTAPTAPKGYALVSIDALKAWNKYDEVLTACQYSIKE